MPPKSLCTRIAYYLVTCAHSSTHRWSICHHQFLPLHGGAACPRRLVSSGNRVPQNSWLTLYSELGTNASLSSEQLLHHISTRGIEHEFSIGVDSTLTPPTYHQLQCMLLSSPTAWQEVAAGTLALAFTALHSQQVHLSPIGIILKPHQLDKFRLIVDLSAPHGASINDTISLELSSFTYPKVDQAAGLIAEHTYGALITKLDLHSVYRKVPIHPDDSHQLGIKCEGTTYLDRALSFGLSSVHKVFTAVADGYVWAIAMCDFSDFTHYLDDLF